MPRRVGRGGYSLAEVVVALGVAATGLAGVLAGASAAASASRDVAALTGAIQVARACLARRGEFAAGRPAEWFADAGAEIRHGEFPGARYRIEVHPCGAGRCRPVRLTIFCPPRGGEVLRLMTAVAAADRGVVP
jgi:hypothetical protein